MNDAFFTTDHRALQDRFDSRRLADRLAETRLHTAFTDDDRAVIARAPFLWLATTDVEGWPDVSYKGGRPGFVRVIDDTTFAFPSYDGNGMYRSMGNIVSNPRVSVLFVDFEHPSRVRVRGVATLHDERELIDQWPGSELIVTVRAEQIFPNCPRYLHEVTINAISKFAPDAGYEPPQPEWKSYPGLQPYLPTRPARQG